MKKYKTIKEVWEDIDKGVTIYWSNKSYKVIKERDNCPELKMYSNRGDYCLSTRHVETWFGCKIQESELGSLYSINEDV